MNHRLVSSLLVSTQRREYDRGDFCKKKKTHTKKPFEVGLHLDMTDWFVLVDTTEQCTLMPV